MQRTDVLKLWMDNKQKQTQKCHSNKNNNFIPISKGIFETKPVQLMRFQEKTMNTYLPKQLIRVQRHSHSQLSKLRQGGKNHKKTHQSHTERRTRPHLPWFCQRAERRCARLSPAAPLRRRPLPPHPLRHHSKRSENNVHFLLSVLFKSDSQEIHHTNT